MGLNILLPSAVYRNVKRGQELCLGKLLRWKRASHLSAPRSIGENFLDWPGEINFVLKSLINLIYFLFIFINAMKSSLTLLLLFSEYASGAEKITK